MAEFKMPSNTILDLLCEVHDGCELLPLYCMDCDCPLCCDCVTRDHVGHTVRKVSEVVETQLRQLEKYLDSDKSVLFLEKLLSDSQRRQTHLAKNRESLLRSVLDREEELIEKAKLWREKMTERIITFAEEQTKSIDKGVTITSALLLFKDRGQDLEKEFDSIKVIFLNRGLRNLLNCEDNNRSGIRCLENLEFTIGKANDDLFNSFGQLNDMSEELSSDVCHCEEEEEKEEEEEEEEEEEFYESSDFKMLMKFRSDSIDNIVPLQNSKILLLCKGTVFSIDVNKDESHHQSILSDVHQIALIPKFWDVLSLKKNQKDIKRISHGSLVTTFIGTNNDNERYESVGPAGEQAYACIVHSTKIGKYNWITHLSLLDEFGRILMSYTLDSSLYCNNEIRSLVGFEPNKFIVIKNGKVVQHSITGDTIKKTQIYSGSVGTNPSFSFHSKDIAIDHRSRILLVVPRDNAIHLLDTSLTFQKLLMTEEDGLKRPTSVALDTEGYLYVGCKEGQIHVVNYQYLLNTNRLTRSKIERINFNERPRSGYSLVDVKNKF